MVKGSWAPKKPPKNSRQLETEDHKSVKFVSQKEEIETFSNLKNLNPENEVTGKSFYNLSFFTVLVKNGMLQDAFLRVGEDIFLQYM